MLQEEDKMSSQNLVSRLILPVVGVVAVSAVIGCGGYRDFSSPYSQPKQVQRQTQPEKPKHEVLTPCTQPKVIVNQDNPRFKDVRPHYFWVCSMNAQGGFNVNDERWVYHRGERFAVMCAVPKSLWGSKVNFVMGSPTNEILMARNQMSSKENDSCGYKFDASTILDNFGSGDYRFSWGFDGEIVCLQYVRIKE